MTILALLPSLIKKTFKVQCIIKKQKPIVFSIKLNKLISNWGAICDTLCCFLGLTFFGYRFIEIIDKEIDMHLFYNIYLIFILM